MQVKELYVDSLQFSYGPQKLQITGVYLKCGIGEVIAVFGRNGSGKSTLMQLIFGTLRADHSFILINGKRTKKPYLTGKVGFLPQHSFLPTHKKVSSLVELLVNDPHVKKTLLMDQRIQELIHKRVYELSGGERRYLEIWLLLCQPTDFILLDEPFTGIEPIYVTHITDLIEKFRNQKGFIISDHNYRSVLAISSQILLMENGSCRTLQHQHELEHFYLPYGSELN